MHGPALKPQPTPEDAGNKALIAPLRWAHLLPVDFRGEDTSLTQAQLAVLR